MRTLIIILSCLLLTGFTKNDNRDWNKRKAGKMINISINQIPNDLDPTKLRMMEHFLLLQLYSQTLVRVDESGELVSYLAKRWEYNANRKEFIFFLDEKAKFSDGTVVTSKDVVWSLSRHFWKDSPSVVASYLGVALDNKGPIAVNQILPAFKILGEHSFSIHLKSFYHPLLHVLTMPGFSITKYQNESFSPIGSGPLKLENDVKKGNLIFTKNILFTGKIELYQVSVTESSSFENTKKLFAEGQIDLALGVNSGDIDEKALSSLGVVVTPSDSLAVAHAYYNTTGILKNDHYRTTISGLLSSTMDDLSKGQKFLERIKTFFPVGIMPMSYYKQNNHFQIGSVPEKTIKIALMQKYFSNVFKDLLIKKAHEYKISIDVRLCNGPEILDVLKNKDYDVVGVSYVGNFPDPDAFLDFINSESPIHAGEFDAKSLFANLERSRFISDQGQRLSEYEKSFHEFEQKNYFVPLYRSKIPIVHRRALTFPNTKFRYEGELWRIFWKN
jgi:ABC-type oligopeptide transport system substrate-binding subunit